MASNKELKERSQDPSQVRRVSIISSALAVFHKATEESLDSAFMYPNKAMKVYVRLMFLRIGEIDTLNEKYQAQASIESRWLIESEKILSSLSSDEQKRLIYGKSVSLHNFSELYWHPQLYIENALGDLKEQIRYSAKKSKVDNQIYICEHRDIKGLFWEKLELHHFPSDVQDLSISLASLLYNDKVVLLPDPHHSSGINREAFVDQQEWSLYEHVDTHQRFIKEFLFRNDDEEEDHNDDDDDTNSSILTSKERKRSILTVTCHAARRSNYFYWNGYCLILLITLVSFASSLSHQSKRGYLYDQNQLSFSIQSLSANRLQISCTLLLTSITFRWTVNRSLPTISYLTTMDKYAIMCLFILVILSIWHAIIGGLIFLNTPDFRVDPSSPFVYLDRYVLYIFVSIYVIIHIFLFIWLFCVPLKLRRDLKEKDRLYQELVFRENEFSKKKIRHSALYSRVSMES